MNRDSVIAYGIAVAGGLAWLWFSLSPQEAIVAALATLGLAVIVWHAIDTIDGAARRHYTIDGAARRHNEQGEDKKNG